MCLPLTPRCLQSLLYCKRRELLCDLCTPLLHYCSFVSFKKEKNQGLNGTFSLSRNSKESISKINKLLLLLNILHVKLRFYIDRIIFKNSRDLFCFQDSQSAVEHSHQAYLRSYSRRRKSMAVGDRSGHPVRRAPRVVYIWPRFRIEF